MKTKKPATSAMDAINGETNFEALAREVVMQPRLINGVLAGLGAGEARVKYGCLKTLRILSEKSPELVAPIAGPVMITAANVIGGAVEDSASETASGGEDCVCVDGDGKGELQDCRVSKHCDWTRD